MSRARKLPDKLAVIAFSDTHGDARFFVPGNHDYFYTESQLAQLVKKQN